MPPFMQLARTKRSSEETDVNPRPSKRPSLGDGNAEQYWMVQWRMPQSRKHKTWEGDAVLVVDGTECTMFSMEGKIIGSGSSDLGRKVRVGDELKIGGKEVEVDCSISSSDFLSGRCFSSGSAATLTNPVSSAPTLVKKKFIPLHPVNAFSPNPTSKPSSSTKGRSYTRLTKETDMTGSLEHGEGQQVLNTANGTTKKIEESLWLVNWRKPQGKKHKTWDGDGMVHQLGTTIKFMTEDGKKMLGVRKWDAELQPGSMLFIDEKEIEVDNRIPLSTLTNHGPDLEVKETPPKPVNRTANKFVTPVNFYGAPSKPKEAAPLHNPSADGAVIMKAPNASHMAKYNKKNHPVVPVVVDPFIACHLRPHQKEGVKFLYESIMGLRKHEGFGCILADEMGMGKTLQTIALVWTLLKQNPYAGQGPVVGKVLIVCPVTLVKNWKNEFHKWLGKDRIGIFLGDQDKTMIKQFVNSRIHHVLIIGYERLRSVIADLAYCTPSIGLIICDEGHRLKSSNNKTTKMFEVLKTPRRIILSGTPIQNDLSEFHAMADFCNPGLLDDYSTFRRVFETPILNSRLPNCSKKALELGNERSAQLLDVSKSFVLRRDASILENYLPPKFEYVVFVKPTTLQLSMFTKILRPDRVSGLIQGPPVRSLAVINTLTKICNSPMLLKNSSSEKRKPADDGNDARDVVEEALKLLPHNLLPNDFSVSGKLVALENILRVIRKETEEKIVIVSHYTATLDIIEKFCEKKRYSYSRLDGQTPQAKRQEYVNNFNKASQLGKFVFLLSAKAGGVGLNLIGASRLVLFDSDWNPSHDLQAMARIHRDGQKRPVFIYRLLATGTIDEKIYQRQITKMGLSDSLMNNQQSTEGGTAKSDTFSHKDLKDLFTILPNTVCNTHDLLDCHCDGGGPDSAPISKNDTKNDHGDEDEEMGFMIASQLDSRDLQKSTKKKKAELAALDEWNHINCLQPSVARDSIQDLVLRQLLYSPPAKEQTKQNKVETTVYKSRVDELLAAIDIENIQARTEPDPEGEVMLRDAPSGTVTFLFEKKKAASL